MSSCRRLALASIGVIDDSYAASLTTPATSTSSSSLFIIIAIHMNHISLSLRRCRNAELCLNSDGIFPDSIFQLTEELQCSCVANSSSAGQAAAYSSNTECNIECMHSHECSALHFAKGKAPPALQLPTKVITAQKLGLSSVTVEHIALPLETVKQMLLQVITLSVEMAS